MTDCAFEHINHYLEDLGRILNELKPQLQTVFPRFLNILDRARRNGRTVFVMGNGGSAAAASHLANDINKFTIVEGQRRYKCVALTDNVALMTAWANDASYGDLFVEQLRNLMEPEDILIGISGSGNSANCVRAMHYARQAGAVTVSWTGFGGGQMMDAADLAIVIPSDSMVHCENCHLIVHHCLVSLMKHDLEAAAQCQTM